MNPIIRDEKRGIAYRRWSCPDARAAAVLVHGMGAHTGRWQFLCECFLKNGITSYAIELKGFGETGGLKGHVDSAGTYFSDIRSLYTVAREQNAGKKFFILGESMGALIALAMMACAPAFFSGLICISPAFESRLKVRVLDYASLLFSIFFNRKKQLTMSFNSKMCTRDTAYQELMDRDPREHRLASAGLLMEIVKLQLRSPRLARGLKIPALFLTAGDDTLVNPDASERIFNMIGTKDKRLINYPDMRHALSIDMGKEKVFSDILVWMDTIIGR